MTTTVTTYYLDDKGQLNYSQIIVPNDEQTRFALQPETTIRVKDEPHNERAVVDIYASDEILERTIVQSIEDGSACRPTTAADSMGEEVFDTLPLHILGVTRDGKTPVADISYSYEKPASTTNKARR